MGGCAHFLSHGCTGETVDVVDAVVQIAKPKHNMMVVDEVEERPRSDVREACNNAEVLVRRGKPPTVANDQVCANEA